MATTLIGEKRVGSGGIRLNGNSVEFVETYEYLVDGGTSSETRINVLNTTGLPIVGITQNASGAVCSSKTAERDTVNTQYWHVICEFSSLDNDQQIGVTSSPDPTTWIPIYRVGYEAIEEVFTVTENGVPVLNSAKQKFQTPLTRTKLIPTFQFSQYFPDTLTEYDVTQYNAVVNDRPFIGFSPYTLLLTVEGSERGFFNGYAARRIDFKIRYKQGMEPGTWYAYDTAAGNWYLATDYSGWGEMIQDTGITYIASSKRKSALDDDGYRIEVGLNGAGSPVAFDEEPAILGFLQGTPIDFNGFLRR